MDRIKKIITSKEIKGTADYFSLYKEIEKEAGNIKTDNWKRVKIALLSSFTVKGMKEVLSVKCYEIGILPEIYVADYNQYSQEILNPGSEFYEFGPDLVILFIDSRAILGEQYLLPYSISEKQREDWIKEKSEEIKSLVGRIKEKLNSKILLHNLEVPLHSPLGIMDNKEKFGFKESIIKLNLGLNESFKDDAQVFVFDYDGFSSSIGKKNIMDYKMYHLGDIKIDLQHMPELCDEYLAYIKPLMSLTRKCIVLDLDNTLWGGIVGEDGLGGIKLGPTPEGRPFLEFQKYLLSLFNRGIILAINSKNNPEDVKEVFEKHPNMILKEEHFASMQINWDDKISNMKVIAEEINIGLDSLVFVDDDKLNREMIREEFPEVLVLEMPDDPALYLKTLMEVNDFNTLQITEEDKKKGMMYAEQRKRTELHKTATDITEYLKNLKMVVTIEKASSFNIPRISQMTQKTNQFNMTTRRYPEEDIKKFSESDNFLVSSIRVEDKFGDNGITGAAIVEKGNDEWRIDTFLLSCRVIGRRVEETLLAYILKEAKKENAKLLVGEFIHTKKNTPAKDFYRNQGFKLTNEHEEMQSWEFDVSREHPYPDFIKVVEE